MDTNTIKVIDTNFNFKGEIDDYSSFYFIRNFTKAKEFQLIAPIKYIDILKDGNIIFTTPKKAGIIEEPSIDESKGIIIVKGRDLKSIVGRRVTLPPEGKMYDEIKSNAEAVIKHYIEVNCINPIDPKRKIQQLQIATNRSRGIVISWQSRFKYLDFEIEQLCNSAGLGYEIYLDIDNKKLIFDVIEGVNRAADNDSRVIFSEEFDNITDSTHTSNSLSYKTMGYVAGQGQEDDRIVQEIFKTLDEGINRRELFIDARDISENENLQDRGKAKLAEYDYITSNESTVINSNFIYEEDWDLGDLIILKNRLGESVERIAEVTEVYEGNRKIDIVLGSVIPLPTEKINNQINSIPNSNGASKMWRPSINISGDLSWGLNSSLDVPTTQNIKGPKGDTGIQGPKGEQGVQGLKGDRGEQGPQGIPGIQGAKGDTGPQGLKGDQGIQGPKGDKIAHKWQGTILKLENPDGTFETGVDLRGLKGDKGDVGERGPQGIQGVQGPAGNGQSYVVFQRYFIATEGQQNFSWNDGYVYPVGINAIAVYINGMRIGNKAFVETSGSSIQIKRPLNNGEVVFIEAMQAVKDLQGPQGPQGIPGPKGDKGDKGDQGIKGDTGLQGPKGDTGATGERGPQGLKGEQGIQGIQGIKGDKGEQGIQGPKGDTGAQGIQGIKGDRGNDGITPTIGANGNWFLGSSDTGKSSRGIQGVQGARGEQGIQGIQGPKGDTGAQGATGAQGPRGDTGATGAQGPPGKDGTQIITSSSQPSGHISGRVWIQLI